MGTTIRPIGLSSDYRTNRWAVTCECGKSFEPSTTLRSRQVFACPRCGTEYITDYNAEPHATIKKLTNRD